MTCGICGTAMTRGIRDYPQREQLDRHMWVAHRLNAYIVKGKRAGYVKFVPETNN